MTPTETENTQKPAQRLRSPTRAWWLGVTEMLGQGLYQGTKRVERAHLAIAEESFRILREVPLIKPVSESVKRTHDLVAVGTYAGVGGLGKLLSAASRTLRQPRDADAGNLQETGSQPDAGSESDRHPAR